jgi:hypothetical protein
MKCSICKELVRKTNWSQHWKALHPKAKEINGTVFVELRDLRLANVPIETYK